MEKKAIREKEWHEKHAFKLKKREATHSERLLKWRATRENAQEYSQSDRLILDAPLRFSFISNHDEACKFINQLREVVLVEGKSVTLNLTMCEEISPEACLVLYAELERIFYYRNKGSVDAQLPKAAIPFSIMKAFGFFSLFKYMKGRDLSLVAKPSIMIAPVTSATIGKPEEVISGINKLFEHSLPVPIILDKALYRVLTEAMNNTVEHAYPQDEEVPWSCGHWWRAGFSNRENNSTYVVFYDQGVGIPNTLNKNWSEAIRAVLSVLPGGLGHGETIEIATRLKRTGSDKEGRGNGLRDLKRLIDVSDDGSLTIQSLKGEYIYPHNKAYLTKDYEINLQGTLIVWTIKSTVKVEQVAA